MPTTVDSHVTRFCAGFGAQASGLENVRFHPAHEAANGWDAVRFDAGDVAGRFGSNDRRNGRTDDHRIAFRL